MTLKQALKEHQNKRPQVICKVGKYYHYFHKKDELDKLADLEVIDTLTNQIKVMSLFSMKKAKSVNEFALVVDTEKALKVLGKERF